MAFATSDHLALAYSAKRIGELAGDGTVVLPAAFATNDAITWALERATEEILMYCRKGKKYSEEDLQTLADSTTAGWSLRGLTVDLAYTHLQQRKGVRTTDLDQLSPGQRNAIITLNLLAEGEEVFPRLTGDEHEDAGTPRTADLTRQTTSPTLSQSWSQQASQRLIPNSPLTQNPYSNWP